MKKIILVGAAVALITGAFAFTGLNSTYNGNEDYCVTLTCGSKTWKETIHCFSSSEARSIMKAKYPNCRVGTISHGACK